MQMKNCTCNSKLTYLRVFESRSKLDIAAVKAFIDEKERRSVIAVPHKARARRTRDDLNAHLDETGEIGITRDSFDAQSIRRFSLARHVFTRDRMADHIVKHVSARETAAVVPPLR